MSNLGISFQPLSRRIYIGRLNKANTLFLDGKEDHTETAVAVVAEYALSKHDGALTLTEPDGSGYDITVKRLPANTTSEVSR